MLADGKSLGEPVAIYNAAMADGNWYTVTEDNAHVRLVRPINTIAVENGILDIPSNVILAGTNYEISAVEGDAFTNYSGLSTIFLRPETAPAGIETATAVLPSETAFYVENYDNYADMLGQDIYAILKNIELSEPVSNILSMNTGDEFQFNVIYTPAEHINHEITIGSDPVDMFDFTQGSFAEGRKAISGKILKSGNGIITVTSAQPGETIEKTLEIRDISTGIEDISENNYSITTSGNTIIVSGLANGYTVNVFNAAGQNVASRISEGQTIYIDMPASGLYIVSAGNKGVKVSL